MNHTLKMKLQNGLLLILLILLRPQPEVDKVNAARTWSVYLEHAIDIEDTAVHLVL